MNAGPPAGDRLFGRLVRLLTSLFALALRLYPARVRREYADEMQAVFALRIMQAARPGAPLAGLGKLLILAGREIVDLPFAILSAHLRATGGPMNAYFPATTDQTRWPVALLSLLPFLIGGPLRIIASFQPGWSPKEQSWLFLIVLVAAWAASIGSVMIGAVTKFPRWSYPSVVYLAFSFSYLVTYAVYSLGFKIFGLDSFYLVLVFILIILCLPGLRWFYRNIAQDWTLLSYGLYAVVLYFLSGLDFDETPHLNAQVLLPSVIALCAALAHLRIRSAFARMAALVAGTFVGLFIWIFPVALGMISIIFGVIIAAVMLLVFGTILIGLLLSPMIVTYAVRSWRASRPAH